MQIDTSAPVPQAAPPRLVPSAPRPALDLAPPYVPAEPRAAPHTSLILPAAVPPVTSDPLEAIDWGTRLATRTVDVYFAPGGTYIDGVRDFGPAVGWSAFERSQVLRALDQIETFTNLTFRVSTTSVGAEFRLGLFDLSSIDAIAFMQPPGKSYPGFSAFDPYYLRLIDADSRNPLLSTGGFIYAILLEELGHGLGLAHAHDDGGSSAILEGVTAPVGSYGIGDLNQGVFSAMNYNEGWPAGPMGSAYDRVNDFGYEATMMALDVAVLQRKYGVNLSFATGDNTYRLPDANGLGTDFRCIWDAGGIDTLRYDGTRAAVLDLRPATLNGEVGGGGWVSFAAPVRGGFTIASGVVIENAVGGEGADRVVGNDAANGLRGRGGNDRLDWRRRRRPSRRWPRRGPHGRAGAATMSISSTTPGTWSSSSAAPGPTRCAARSPTRSPARSSG